MSIVSPLGYQNGSSGINDLLPPNSIWMRHPGSSMSMSRFWRGTAIDLNKTPAPCWRHKKTGDTHSLYCRPSLGSQHTMEKGANIWVFVLSFPFYCRCPHSNTPPFSLARLNTHFQQTSRSERKQQHSVSLVSVELNCKEPPDPRRDPDEPCRIFSDSCPPYHDLWQMSQPGSLLMFYLPPPPFFSHKTLSSSQW